MTRFILTFGFWLCLLSVAICDLSEEEYQFAYNKCVVDKEADMCRLLIQNGYFTQNIDECDKDSCLIVGWTYKIAGYESQAMEYLKKAIDLGQSEAYSYLGDLYIAKEEFIEAKQNYEKCIKKCAYKLSKVNSALWLGAMYEGGKYAKQDTQKAIQLYKMACDSGILDAIFQIAFACYRLGEIYANGTDIETNIDFAKKYYGKSCELGFTQGCDDYNLIEKGVQ
ncbi:tetratricopeptide repeat protein [Helicobacter sp. T3_23-1059]